MATLSNPPLLPTSSPISLSFPSFKASANDASATDASAPEPDNTGRVAVLTFNTPQKLNAMTWRDWTRLAQAMEWIDRQEHVLVTVLTGNGRFFSAGADVKDPSRGLPSEISSLDPTTAQGSLERQMYFTNRITNGNGALAHAFMNHSKILVGACNGPAVGISATLLGHCDLVYCFPEFWLLTPFTSLGLVAEGLASVTFVKKMGLGRAQEALLEGRKLTAEELRETGFVSRIFPSPPPSPSPSSSPSSSSTPHPTPPILPLVLTHICTRLLPPTLSASSLLHTKSLLRHATYDHLSPAQANEAEVRGAVQAFKGGEPERAFERVARGGRHKL